MAPRGFMDLSDTGRYDIRDFDPLTYTTLDRET